MAWYINNDQLLKVEGLRDPVTSAYVNAAIIEATMYESDGVTPVSGQSWPLTLDYVSASNGNYQGLLEDGRVLTYGEIYWIEVRADAGSDLIKTWRWSDRAIHRGPV